MKNNFSTIILVELTRLLKPLEQLDNPSSITSFVQKIGWVFPEGKELNVDLKVLVNLVTELRPIVSNLVNANADDKILEDVNALTSKILDIIKGIRNLAPNIETAIKAIPGIVGESSELAEKLSRRILDYLLYLYLEIYNKKVFAVLHVMGIVEIIDDSQHMPIKTIQWQRIPKLFIEPLTIAQEVYSWGHEIDPFDGDEFLHRFELLMRAFLLPGGIYSQADYIRTKFKRIEAGDDQEIRMPLYQGGNWPDNYQEFDLNLFPIPPDGDKKSGLALYPYVFGDMKINGEISENWIIKLTGNADLSTGLGLELRPPNELYIQTKLFSDLQESIETHLELEIVRKSPAGEMTYIFGSKDGSRLGYKDLGFSLYLAIENGAYTIAVEMAIEDLTLVIDAGKGDGFIQKILSGLVLESVNDLIIGVSNKEGFYFRGSSALSITIPVHKRLGPIDLNTVLIGIGFGDEIKIILATSFDVHLGPITGSIKNMGLQLPLSFPDDGGGNLGPVNVEGINFLAPTGVGLVVDMSGITGGGFLEFDEVNKSYAGILELNFGEIGLVAIGLITTGSKSFSMLIILSVKFNPAIQLSFGFTLSAVGGLIGINRQANVDFLREGLRAKTLDSILFPENPIENADLVISNLRDAFPPTEGRFIVGPMVKIGWGSPNIITADICIILELPSPIRIILLGQIEAQFPDEREPLVVLHIDVLGILDFDKKSFALDGTIYDLRILTYTLTGDAAIRLNWGEKPDFAMSLGGFHPKFSPPPGFPLLRRLTLALSAGKNLQLSSQVYFALTANTLQFGCQIQLYAKYSGATLEGFLSFDTLIYFKPFYFVATMSAGVSVKYRGHRLASIHLFLELSGPSPWRAVGEASFSILCWDVSVDFDESWGPAITNQLEPIDPWVRLEEALNQKDSWISTLGQTQQVENFVSADVENVIVDETNSNGNSEPILIHPIGGLEIREKVLPLNHSLELLGNAPVNTYNRFEVKEIRAGGNDSLDDWEYIDEYFARGQFESLTDDQKLSLPSFEKMPGGVRVAGRKALQVPEAVECEEMMYESTLIGDNDIGKVKVRSSATAWDFSHVMMLGAAQNKAMQSGNMRFHQRGVEPLVSILDESFVIVDRDRLQPVEGLNGGKLMNRTIADHVLAKIRMRNPTEAQNYVVIATSELEDI